MNVFVTGVAGFIGARTAEVLLDAGYTVSGLDNLNDYYDVALKRYRLERLMKRPGFQFHSGDVENSETVNSLFGGGTFDAVVHLAARAGVRASIVDPSLYLRTNTCGTLNVLQAMERLGIPRLVIASTSSLYAGQEMPFREDAMVTKPLSPYAATKLAAESLCYVWHHLYRLNICVLRYFTVFGPAGRPDMAPFRFCECIRRGSPLTLFGDGTQTRDFTYIDDIAKGTRMALGINGWEIVNLGGGNRPLSILTMIAVMEEETGRKADIVFKPVMAADMTDTAGDISKAARLMNWSPEVDPMDGLRRTARWHLENAAWLNKLSL